MEHKYSTIILVFLGLLVLFVSIVSAIDSEDMDLLCNTNNALVKRINGLWTCSKTSFGEMVITNATTISIPAYNTYYNITNMTIQHGQNIISNNNSCFEITKDGYYKMIVTTSFSGGGNTEYEMEMFINNQENKHCELKRKMGTGGDVGSASFSCIDYLYENDIIVIKVSDNTNPSQDISIKTLNFNIQEIQ